MDTGEIKEFIAAQIEFLRKKLKGKKALIGFSGGIDSAVCATLAHMADPDSLTCIFVDHGLLRKDEVERVMKFKTDFSLNIIKVDAAARFISALKGVVEPESKRKVINREFLRVFESEADKLGKLNYLLQNTIRVDVVKKDNKLSKIHYDEVGLPDTSRFDAILEPLKGLTRAEVRLVARHMRLPYEIVNSQPFPGPGFGVRIIGQITTEKVQMLRAADAIFREELKKADLADDLFQYFAVLTNARSIGVKKGERIYGHTIALRAVTSDDGLRGDFARIPMDVLAKTSTRITDEIEKITRVVYDITAKPPATIEWE